MSNPFFEKPILNSPYDYPSRHWELDNTGQPTQQTIQTRRPASFITPIPKPRKQKGMGEQTEMFGNDISTTDQKYDITALINAIRNEVGLLEPSFFANRLLDAPFAVSPTT